MSFVFLNPKNEQLFIVFAARGEGAKHSLKLKQKAMVMPYNKI